MPSYDKFSYVNCVCWEIQKADLFYYEFDRSTHRIFILPKIRDQDHTMSKMTLSYLVQTTFGLFLKGVGKTSEKITRGISRRTKFRFSGSIGNVESFLSGSKDHSVIFFFSWSTIVVIFLWNKILNWKPKFINYF